MKLVYFNGRGLAETSRLVLAYAGADYEDFRYPLEIVDWKTFNFIREEFIADRDSGKLRRSMNKVPFLEVDGEVICQSKAIERFLARKFNLMGDNELEAARIDAVCEVVRDLKDAYQGVRRLKEGDERDEGMRLWFNETLPSRLVVFQEILGENGYAVGGRTSLADIILYSFLTQFFDNKEGARNSYTNCLKIRDILENVGNNENIRNWLENRPESSF